MAWEKLSATNQIVSMPIWFLTQENRKYHNIDHIMDCFDFLEENEVPYDIDLEIAIWWHDVIYDEYPDKEVRSADLLMKYKDELPENANMDDILRKINLTISHEVSKCVTETDIWMIKADLRGLSSPASTIRNYAKIMDESVALYNCSEEEFAKGNIDFMRDLFKRVSDNLQLTKDQYWLKVLSGIEATRKMSYEILYDRGFK